MNMRPKTKRRLVILGTVVTLTFGSAGGFYFFRQHQIEGQIVAARAAGLDAFRNGDYNVALKHLSKYNEKRQRDPETLFAFAKARSRVETPNYRHLAEAIAFYRRGLELQPNNAEAKHALLELYTNPYVAYNAEGLALANQLLGVKDASKDDSADADLGTVQDIAAIRAKARVLYRLRKLNGALAASQKLNDLAPLDVEGQRLTYELMYQLKKPGGEILARAQAARKANPDDPRFTMLEGYACMLTERLPEAKDLLLGAAKAKAPDAGFVRELSGMLDAMRLYDETNSLLERSAAQSHDPEMQRMLVQRLWQAGKYAEVVDRLADLAPATGDSQLLAYRAMCLFQVKKADEARPILEELGKRKEDDAALAWAKALRTRFDSPNLAAGQQIAEYQAALGRDPYNPVIRYMMGESYAALGETEPALQNWRMVADAVPSWATPRTQIARLLTDTGRPELAIAEAAKAYGRAQNAGAAIGLAVAWAGQVENTNDPDLIQKVLTIVTDIQTKLPNEPETLPIYASLLARSGQTDQAAKIIRDIAGGTQELPEGTFLRLAGVSHSLNLGLEKALFDRAEKLKGVTPSLAMARAISDATPAKGDDKAAAAARQAAALESLQKQAAAATANVGEWKLMVARFMQSTNDPAAKDNWVRLGTENPADLNIQAAIAELPEDSDVWKDRTFVDQTIQRLRTITGDEGHRWQLARARWLLRSDNADRDSAEAVVLLTDLVRSSPGLMAPRVYLARALENVNQIPQAVEQLKTAAEIDRTSPLISLELARLLQQDGRFEEANQYLDRLTRSKNLDADQRTRAAAMLAKGGDAEGAIKLLEAPTAGGAAAAATTPTVAVTEPSRQLLLAALHRRKGEFEAAGKIYQDLLKNDDADAHAIVDAADFFATRGDQAAARAAMARLPKAKLAADQRPEQRALLAADFEERHGSPQAALKLLTQATAETPTSADAWVQLAGYRVRHDDFGGAAAAADQGIKAAGQNPKLSAIKTGVAKLQQLGSRDDLQPLVSALSQAPDDKGVTDTLNELIEQKQNGESAEQAATRMLVNADRHPRFMPAQKLAAGALLRLKRYDEAAKVANRCINVFPNDPEAPEMAVAVHASTGRWSDMLGAAEEWRARSTDRPMRPTLAIAEARMQMNQAARAITELTPFVESAMKDPNAGRLVVFAYARALVLDGRQDEAAKVLTPLLSTDAQWRALWLRLASLLRTGPDAVAQWIETVVPVLHADDAGEQQALASAWYGLGTRLGYTSAFARARTILDGLAKRPDAKVGTFLLLAATCEKMSQPDNAIDAYRKALAIEPNLPGAQNNLAYQLLMTNQRLDEARELARKAVAAEANEASYQDTLARILARTGDRPGAIRAYQTLVQMQPNNIEANIGLAQTLADDGKRDDASQVLGRIDALLHANPTAGKSYAQDLTALRQKLDVK
jgi:tetratricopeptide (TPR) repeat protein